MTDIPTFPGAQVDLDAAELVLVPKEATPSMSLAGVIEIVNAIGRMPLKTDIAAKVYRAMLDAIE